MAQFPGIVGVSTKILTREYWLREKDAPGDVKKPYESAKTEDVTQKLSNTGNACRLFFVQCVFTTLRYLLRECDRYVHHLMYDHQHDSWRFVFAVLPVAQPVLYNITWRHA